MRGIPELARDGPGRVLAVAAVIAALLGAASGAGIAALLEGGDPGPPGPRGPAGPPGLFADVGVLEARIQGLQRRVERLERALDGR